MIEDLIWERQWSGVIAVLAVAFLIVVIVSYVRTPVSGWKRGALALLKATAVTLLLACLLNPTTEQVVPKPGENLLLIAVDQSRSLDLTDDEGTTTRRQQVSDLLDPSQAWLRRLEEDFQVQYYGMGEQLRPVKREEAADGQESQSDLLTQSSQLLARYDGRPVAGLILLTDGLATDELPSNSRLSTAPVYPVLLGDNRPPLDLSLEDVRANPTNFETTPLVITAQLRHVGLAGSTAVVAVQNSADKELVRQTIDLPESGGALLNLEVPEFEGPLARYRVIARLAREIDSLADVPTESSSREVTLLNNHKRLIVPRQGGPFRMLYVAGRPNWEFKFLRRAAQVDPEVKLLGLMRLAVKEPRFAFLDRSSGSRNPLFGGFDETQQEEVAEYDEPVLVRLGTLNEDELRDGFPKTAEELFEFSAVILDDVDAEFFTQDQLDLLRTFVDRRGGGLLMLGGPQGFDQGGFDRSSLAEVIPVYSKTVPTDADSTYRWSLTREGWLEPWARLRDTQEAEQLVRAKMPSFLSVNQVERVKPGAQLLGTFENDRQQSLPALATQTYGRGRSAALMAGDLFRWKLQTPSNAAMTAQGIAEADIKDDFGQLWRQLLRWLVADLPQRVSAESNMIASGTPTREILVDVRTEEFLPDDAAQVTLEITYPDGQTVSESAKWTLTQGRYRGEVMLSGEGYYEVKCTAIDRAGEEVGTASIGWAWEPTGDEYRRLTLESGVWEEVVSQSQGKILTPDQLRSVDRWLDTDKLTEKEIRQKPLWHQWPVLVLALALLAIEWGWRRWMGLA